MGLEQKILSSSIDIGFESLPKDQLRWEENSLAKPAYDNLQKQMLDAGWVDIYGKPAVYDLKIDRDIDKNEETGMYSLRLTAYRGGQYN